jgi:hypothetical protein
MLEKELCSYLYDYENETPHLEYKESISWDDTNSKEKIIQTILAMSNIRDGGVLVIGVKEILEEQGKKYRREGMSDEHYNSFDEDRVRETVRQFAEPFVALDLIKKIYDNNKFVIITVKEFDEIPVICRKSGKSDNLQEGQIYIRPKSGTVSTRKVQTYSEMKELVELAVIKQARKFMQITSVMPSEEQQAIESYNDELKKDLLE